MPREIIASILGVIVAGLVMYFIVRWVLKKGVKDSIFSIIGMIIYLVTSMVDRFIIEIDDYIYIPLIIVGIVMLIYGLVKSKKR